MVNENNKFKELEKKELVEVEGGGVMPAVTGPIVPMLIAQEIVKWLLK